MNYTILLILALFAGGSFVLIIQDIVKRFTYQDNENINVVYDYYNVGGKDYLLPTNIIIGIKTLSTALSILGTYLEKGQRKNLKHKKTSEEFVAESIHIARELVLNESEENIDKN